MTPLHRPSWPMVSRSLDGVSNTTGPAESCRPGSRSRAHWSRSVKVHDGMPMSARQPNPFMTAWWPVARTPGPAFAPILLQSTTCLGASLQPGFTTRLLWVYPPSSGVVAPGCGCGTKKLSARQPEWVKPHERLTQIIMNTPMATVIC